MNESSEPQNAVRAPELKPEERSFEILLVEDSAADIRLTQEALSRTEVLKTLHVTRDGAEGMLFLNQEGAFVDAPRPDLVLLDLNLPKKDGRQVLKEIKGSASLREIPVVVLSTSCSPRDIADSYQASANCYVSKPIELDAFIGAIRALEDFWLRTAMIPNQPRVA